MRCPYCYHMETKVIDSRLTEEGISIRRRRECISCERRFTTFERLDELPLLVVKRDGRREPFDRNKILNGLIKACEKRPISVERLEDIVNEIEKDLKGRMEREINSKDIGKMVMDTLRKIDEVAYVRFASVYRRFKDVDEFMEELRRLQK